MAGKALDAAALESIPVGGSVYLMNRSGLYFRTRIGPIDEGEFVALSARGTLKYDIENLGRTFVAFEARCQHKLFPVPLFAVVGGNHHSVDTSVKIFKTREQAIKEAKSYALTCAKALGVDEKDTDAFDSDNKGAWVKCDDRFYFWNITETEL